MREETGKSRGDSPVMGRIGDRPYWIYRLSILLRAFHQIGAAVFLSAYLLEAVPAVPRAYLYLAVASGILLTLTEWLRHRQIFRELAGAVTLAKLLLLGAAFHGVLPAPLVVLAFFIAALGAHAPKQVRHRLLF